MFESRVVPPKVRLYFFREFYKIDKKRYFDRIKQWEEEKEAIREEHIANQAYINAERALKGEEPLYERAPDHPKPFLHVFIPKAEMAEMIKEALQRRSEWDLIIRDKSRPVFQSLVKLKKNLNKVNRSQPNSPSKISPVKKPL